ncbi:MAG: hypothetical protein KatS3mg091_179 [Patescibacteria group bacterium]|nr:MAG: hypothetical protein KatS3mg091_179 [Patescibacteria group bacterium]
MKQGYKIYFLKDKITAEQWQKVFKQLEKVSKRFSLIFEFKENSLNCNLFVEKDLPPLIEKIGYVLLKKNEDIDPKPAIASKAKPAKNFKFTKYKNLNELLSKTRQNKNLKFLVIEKGFFLKLFPFFKLSILWEENGEIFVLKKTVFSNIERFLEIDFGNKYLLQKEELPICLDITKAYEILGERNDLSLLEIEAFPFSNRKFYLNLSSFDFLKHSLIVGQTGVGKSKFIQLFIEKLSHFSDEYSVVLIDHASIEKNLQNISKEKISFDFVNSYCELFPSQSEPKISTELTLLLFKTLLSQSFNSKLERVLKYSLYLLFNQEKMNLEALKKFLTDIEFKNKLLETTQEDFLKHFF